MMFENLQLEDVIILEDKKRKPLSTMERRKRKGIYPYYGAQEIIDSIDDYIFDGKYILLAEDGENLKSRKKDLVKIVEGKFWLNNHAHIFKTKDYVDLEYLYYYLLRLDLSEYITGSTQPKLNQENMNKIKIKLPKFELQQKIAKILSSIDSKIKLNNDINNNLYKIGDNLYDEYFGKYKDNLPSNYRVVKLSEVADNYDSKRKPMSSREREQHKGIYPYYGATSIIDYVDDYIFDDTYLLMGEDGTVKTDEGFPVLQYIWGKNWINNHTHVLKGKNISTELLMFALRKINIENIITGAVQPKINQENMNKIEFIIGTDFKNKELEKILTNLMNKSKNIIEENSRLEQLRDTLLPKLMNGEIDLDNIKI